MVHSSPSSLHRRWAMGEVSILMLLLGSFVGVAVQAQTSGSVAPGSSSVRPAPSMQGGGMNQGAPAIGPGTPSPSGLTSPSPYPQGLPSPVPYPGGIPSTAISPPGTNNPGAIPSGTMPSGAFPPGTFPPGTVILVPGMGQSVISDPRAVSPGFAGPGMAATPQSMPAGPGPYTALQMTQSFRQADANGDGELTRAEAQRLPIMLYSFEDMDRNKDGVLSRSEYENGAP